MMKVKEIIHVLHAYQKWRRGADIPMPDPREIGRAIGGTPVCDDAIKTETTSGIGKTIIVTLRKWFGKPTRYNL